MSDNEKIPADRALAFPILTALALVAPETPIHNREIDRRVGRILALTPWQMNQASGADNKTKLESNTSYVRSILADAGLIEHSKRGGRDGFWRATPRGYNLWAAGEVSEIEALYDQAHKQVGTQQ
jgi:Mrr restriction endonuclease-like protein